MRIQSSTVRNTVGGLFLALGIAYLSATVSANYCDIYTNCAEGTQLYGNEIGCGCMGPGSCWVAWIGHEVRCACDEFEMSICDCEIGCY
jgi:hypothetical protein